MTTIFILQAALVCGVLVWLANATVGNKTWAAAAIVLCALTLLGAGLVGTWVYPPVWSFGPVFAAFIVIALRVWRRAGQVHNASAARTIVSGVGMVVFAVSAGVLLWHGAIGRTTPSETVFDLAAPIESEGVCAISAGASPLLNFHLATLQPGRQHYRGQSYGVDFIAVSPAGFRTRDADWWRPAPVRPEQYRIFAATVRAPCTGRVVSVHDGMPDQPAGVADRSRMAGNHVVLRCEGYDVLLAHMRRGSVRVSDNQVVEVGAPLGEVGNTGNTGEPHLHVSAQRAMDPQPSFAGEPVHVSFGGRFMSRGMCL